MEFLFTELLQLINSEEMVVNIGLGANYRWMLKADKERSSGGLSPEPPMHSSIIEIEPPHIYIS